MTSASRRPSEFAPRLSLQTLSWLARSTIFISILTSNVESRTFEFHNNCQYTVWPGTQPNYQIPNLSSTGFELKPQETKKLSAPANWGGRAWGRTGCSQQGGNFRCETGDCGGLSCDGRGGQTPATLAEFTLNDHGGQDFYDVSLVDGFNIPVAIIPKGGTGDKCKKSDCSADVNAVCPQELTVVGSNNRRIGCKSACTAFGKPEYCCTGEHDKPETCPPTRYSKVFSDACPRAYSYAYDDLRGTFVCKGGDYLIRFCP